MLGSIFSLFVIVVALYIVVNIGAQNPAGVKKTNSKIDKATHGAVRRVRKAFRAFLDD